jgi:sigma-B regulation protein RsbU (phosphoserine phosphatase)
MTRSRLRSRRVLQAAACRGGDYFDVVDLPGNRTLFVVADVSGKGMAAALLAANIQALVRSLSTMAPDVPALASQINRHLFRYTPGKPVCHSSLHRARQGFG